MRLVNYVRKHVIISLVICLAAGCLAFNIIQQVAGSRTGEVNYSEDGGLNIDNGSIWDDPSPEHLLGPGTLK